MTVGVYPVCAWQGVDGETDQLALCHLPAVGYASGRSGERVYACLEHASFAKLAADGGEWDWLPPEGMVLAGPLHTHHEIVAPA